MNWSYVEEGARTPIGFSFAGISAGLKVSGKKDLALILAPANSVCSGLFTQSAVRASCVDLCEKRITKNRGLIRAIIINSGHANACTGNSGLLDSLKATKELAKLLKLDEQEIIICSTGVIGVPLPINNLVKNLPNLVDALDVNSFQNASEAILTTDLASKKVSIETYIEDRCVKIAAIAKGSGMIYPNMATMLGFLTCDVGIPKPIWDDMIKEAVRLSFNAISVDGETSTNDSFIAINSGEKIDNKYLSTIQEGINIVCKDLAKAIARDGEGANCLLEVTVKGAKTESDALKLARSVTNSALVKTAIHGCDPNWGRIISAAGNAGVELDLITVDLYIGDYQILNKGVITCFKKDEVINYMRSKINGLTLPDETIKIIINLNIGNAQAQCWGCDLSKEYIEINSEYTT